VGLRFGSSCRIHSAGGLTIGAAGQTAQNAGIFYLFANFVAILGLLSSLLLWRAAGHRTPILSQNTFRESQ
jgi:hypothetical protein